MSAQQRDALAVLAGTLLLSVAACDSPSETVSQSSNWERSVQCADRGERFAKELKSDAGVFQVNGWTTHYNPTYERCYLLVDYYNPQRATNEIPTFHQRLYDAIQRREVAQFTSDRLSDQMQDVWCRQTNERSKETTSPPCDAVGKYVAELMETR